ncbi:hypothetical protein AGMMS50249_8140 [candidate division SR1 bacterium]|nr:hypothetical protein AGMMS50249_8140 [candidate division SR1 bacterium]
MILEQIQKDYIQAMKDRQETKKLALNYALAQAKQKKIDSQKEITDDDMVSILKKEIKSINEALVFLQKAGNKGDDIVIEKEKISIFQAYLPAMLNQADTQELIEKLISELRISDLKTGRGLLMKELMDKYRSSIDGGIVNDIINAKLSS